MKCIRLLTALILCILISSITIKAQTFHLTDTVAQDPDFITGKLANGLTYYILNNGKAVRNMQLRLVVNAGSLLEHEDQQGMAHFIEHMNFNGLEHFPKNELLSYLESLGVKFGAHLNAFTEMDATSYILWLATEKNKTIDKAFTILEDWDHNALLDEEEVVKERGVVLEESRLDKTAQNRLKHQYFPTLVSHTLYADRFPIGKDSLIQTFNPAGLRYFYSTWYRPDLSAVIVAGDVNSNFIMKKIDEHFSPYTNPVNEVPKPADIVLQPRKKDEFMVLRDKEIQTTILVIYGQIEKTPALVTWNDQRRILVEKLYAQMLNERIKSLVEKPNHAVLAAFVSYDPLAKGYRSFDFRIAVGDHMLNIAVNSLISTIQSTVQFGFLPEELVRAQNTINSKNEEANRESDKTSTASFAEDCQENFIYGTPIISAKDKYLFYKQELGKITLQEVNELGRSIQSQQGKFNLVMTQEGSEAALDQTALAKLFSESGKTEITPYVEKAISGSLLETEPTKGEIYVQSKNSEFGTTNYLFKNGISVTLRPTKNVHDMVKMDAWRYGGSNNFGLFDKQNARYAATIVQAMGIKRFPKPDLDKYLSGTGIHVQPYLNSYEEGIEGHCNPNELTRFLQLIYAYLTAPAKDDALFQSFISTQKALYQNLKANPQNYFSDSTIRFLFQDNPWANTIPSPSDFDHINLDSAFAIYKKVFDNPYGMHFTFVGNFEINTIKPLLETYLGSLATQEKKNRYTDEGLRPRKGVAELRMTKGEEKLSRVKLVFTGEYPVIPEQTISLDFLCEVIKIKILEKLREQMSGIYDASVNATTNKRPYEHYTINISFPCGPEHVDTLTHALLDIIDDIRTNGVEKKYLVSVSKMLSQHHAYLMNTSEFWLQLLSGAWINNEDPKWALKYYDTVDGISSRDLQKTADKYFDMNNFVKEILLPN